MFKDRFLRGGLAGVIAGGTLFIWNMFSYYILHLAKVKWNESISQLVLGHGPKDLIEFLVSVALLLMWNGFLGATFVRFIIPDQNGSYIGRAIGFGLFCWFYIYSLGHYIKLKRSTK